MDGFLGTIAHVKNLMVIKGHVQNACMDIGGSENNEVTIGRHFYNGWIGIGTVGNKKIIIII